MKDIKKFIYRNSWSCEYLQKLKEFIAKCCWTIPFVLERIYVQYAHLGLLDSENNYTSIPISELPEGSEIA